MADVPLVASASVGLCLYGCMLQHTTILCANNHSLTRRKTQRGACQHIATQQRAMTLVWSAVVWRHSRRPTAGSIDCWHWWQIIAASYRASLHARRLYSCRCIATSAADCKYRRTTAYWHPRVHFRKSKLHNSNDRCVGMRRVQHFLRGCGPHTTDVQCTCLHAAASSRPIRLYVLIGKGKWINRKFPAVHNLCTTLIWSRNIPL